MQHSTAQHSTAGKRTSRRPRTFARASPCIVACGTLHSTPLGTPHGTPHSMPHSTPAAQLTQRTAVTSTTATAGAGGACDHPCSHHRRTLAFIVLRHACRYPPGARMHVLAYVYGLAYYAVLSLSFLPPRLLRASLMRLATCIAPVATPDTVPLDESIAGCGAGTGGATPSAQVAAGAAWSGATTLAADRLLVMVRPSACRACMLRSRMCRCSSWGWVLTKHRRVVFSSGKPQRVRKRNCLT